MTRSSAARALIFAMSARGGTVSQRKNPPSVRVHAHARPASRARAPRTSRRAAARYSARSVSMCAASPPRFMKVPTTIDAKPFVLPSALKASTRSITAGSASTNPRRTPGRDDLREGAEPHHEALPVERVEGRDRLALEAKIPVGVVLDHRHAVPGGDVEQGPAPPERHGHPGGIVERRDGVDEPRRGAGRLEPLDLALERLDVEPLVVERDGHGPDPVEPDVVDRSEEGRRLAEAHVAGVRQRLHHEGDRLGRAVRHREAPRLDGSPLLGLELPPELRQEERIAPDVAVLEGHRVGRRVAQRLLGGRGEAGGREQRGVRHPVGERDDVGRDRRPPAAWAWPCARAR